MKRLLALTLCLALLCPAALAAEGEELWQRTEPGGNYVTIRLDYSRYPDTLEVQMDPKQLSADQCISCIREICDHEGIKLLETFTPPEGSDTNGAHA